jgi:UDP-glucose 4-epimerase
MLMQTRCVKRVLVTGSAGHLGEALMRTLTDRGVESIGLDLRPSEWTNVIGSVAAKDQLRQALSGVDVVLHTATLHKPQVAFLSAQAFVDTNITGTLTLLEAAVDAGVQAFVMTSSTTVFGAALVPTPGEPAAWIDESVVPVPKNIYGVTKAAAEDLCQLTHRRQGLNCVVLRVSRFFSELDDAPDTHEGRSDDNVKADEYAFRRVALEDVVEAHLLAAQRAPELGFRRYVISATTPFTQDDVAQLRTDAARIFAQRAPLAAAVWGEQGWRFPSRLDRVYVNALARHELDWHPRFGLDAVASMVATENTIHTPLARLVGAKEYAASTYHHGKFSPPGQ